MMSFVDLSRYNQKWYNRGRNSLIVVLWWIVSDVLFKNSLHNAYKFRVLLLKIFGAKIGNNVRIRPKAEITYPWKLEMGNNVWIDDDVILYNLDTIKIFDNVVISRRSFLCTGSHDVSDPCFGLVIKPINIKNGVWIQADCFVSLGVTIEEESVIMARSNVFSNIGYRKICCGSPCRVIKEREISDE